MKLVNINGVALDCWAIIVWGWKLRAGDMYSSFVSRVDIVG